jgi:hypothetical protein
MTKEKFIDRTLYYATYFNDTKINLKNFKNRRTYPD